MAIESDIAQTGVAASTLKQNEQPAYPLPVAPPPQPGGGDTRPVTREVATVRRNIFIPPSFDWILRPRDPTLRTRGDGWDYEIYEQALSDPKIFSAWSKRKAALAAFPVDVIDASDAPQDKAAGDLLRRVIATVNFAKLTGDLMDGVFKGFAVVELIWALVTPAASGQPEWHPVEARPRDQRRFVFDEFGQLRLVDFEHRITGTPVPGRKFVVHTYNAKDGDPYGRGLGLILWWNAYFKRQNLKAWLIHNDKFGSPTAWGKYPVESAQEDRAALLAAIQAFSTDSAVMTSADTEIELLETARGAGADTFKVLKEAQDQDIGEVILGAAAAANAGPLNGGTAADTDQADRLELAKADASDLADTLNRSWVKWIVEFNLPGAAPPTLKWMIDAEEDLNARADRDTKIEAMGFEPSEDYIRETYGEGWTRKAVLAPVIQDVANFAEAPTRRVAGKLTDQLGVTAAPAIEGWVTAFRQLVGRSGSLEEIRDRLADLYPDLDGTHFAETMSQGVLLADLSGRIDVSGDG